MRLCVAVLLGGTLASAAALDAETIEYANNSFDVVRLAPGEEQNLKFYWKRPDGTPYKTLSALKTAVEAGGDELAFATNGGIYSAQFTPLGLYIENGRRYYILNKVKGGGNFFLLPNGVFYLTARGAHVVETADYSPKEPVTNAVQSGPMLVIDGKLHPRFIPGYHSRYIRSGVGIDGDGRVVFAISNAPVNFHDFGSFFKDRLACANALYLDGRISQMYAPVLNRYAIWSWNQFTTMIALVRAPESK